MATRPSMKRPGYTATGGQWRTIDALRADGWVILDRGQADDLALAVKRAANLLYNVSQYASSGESVRSAAREACEALDAVTTALGGNPYSVAWPRRVRAEPMRGSHDPHPLDSIAATLPPLLGLIDVGL